MPLSEQEQRLLEEMERSLYHNDADFVAAVSARRGRPTYSVVVIGVLVGVLGIAALIAGVIVRQPIVGVLGFVIMFAGVLIAVTPRRNSLVGAPVSRDDAEKERRRGTFMQNLNDRWDKRPEDLGE
jgi:hypothetical protein